MDEEPTRPKTEDARQWEIAHDEYSGQHKPPEWVPVDGGWQKGRLPGAE